MRPVCPSLGTAGVCASGAGPGPPGRARDRPRVGFVETTSPNSETPSYRETHRASPCSGSTELTSLKGMRYAALSGGIWPVCRDHVINDVLVLHRDRVNFGDNHLTVGAAENDVVPNAGSKQLEILGVQCRRFLRNSLADCGLRLCLSRWMDSPSARLRRGWGFQLTLQRIQFFIDLVEGCLFGLER